MTTRESTYLVCVRSFACEDEVTGELFDFTEGISYVDPNHDAAREFPENFAVSERLMSGTRHSAPIPDLELRSESPPATDVSDLLVCIRGFEFQDPDTGYPRWVRYGHDFVEPGSWLDEYYGENFVRADSVVPSDGIPGLPYPDDDE